MQTVTEQKQDKLLDVSMVARRLSVSLNTVYRLIHSGKVKSINAGIKLYRIPASEIDRLLRSPIED
jgi:excisionase family DNA binding protein